LRSLIKVLSLKQRPFGESLNKCKIEIVRFVEYTLQKNKFAVDYKLVFLCVYGTMVISVSKFVIEDETH